MKKPQPVRLSVMQQLERIEKRLIELRNLGIKLGRLKE